MYDAESASPTLFAEPCSMMIPLFVFPNLTVPVKSVPIKLPRTSLLSERYIRIPVAFAEITLGLMVLFPLISPIQLLPADSPKKAMPDAKLPPSETPSLSVPIKLPATELNLVSLLPPGHAGTSPLNRIPFA